MKIEQILSKAVSPARYAGGEFNVYPHKKDAALQFLLCFPDAYEIGMSSLGLKILYGLLNERADTSCELCFAPLPDMGELMQKNNIELFSLSTRKPAKQFDIIGFSLSYELCYTNIPYMLHLARIPLYAEKRGEDFPILLAGGVCTVNPAPFAPFFDIIAIGDGEEVLAELADTYTANKKAGGSKRTFLEKAAKIKGIYVPNIGVKQGVIQRAVVEDLDNAFYPVKVPVANTEAVHNRAMLELFRGCARGCRFCQASFISRPVRHRSPQKLLTLAQGLIRETGYEEMSLSALSACDYPHLSELLQGLKPLVQKAGVRLSLPSTRVDSFKISLSDYAMRKASLTFAPEAGTQRLRDIIKKNISEEDILSAAAAAFKQGYTAVKLYFMIGLPYETEQDTDGIAELVKKIKSLYKQHASNRKPLKLSVSASTFVPKPFTPFQWEKQIPHAEILRIQAKLKNALKPLGVKLSAHNAGASKIEALLARGGQNLAAVIEDVYSGGGKFDGWTEYFDYARWQNSLAKFNLDAETATGEIPAANPLAWDNINVGITKDFLQKELARARAVL